MPCYLLQIMHQEDADAYRDPALKDVVGQMPLLLCALHDPADQLLVSESVKCLRRTAPCWKPLPGATDQAPPVGQAAGPRA